MGLKYVGDGAALPDVPARDLTDAEVSAVPEWAGGEQGLVASGLYEKPSGTKAGKPAKTAPLPDAPAKEGE